MNLRAFLHMLPHGGAAEFAAKIGLKHAVYLHQLAARQDGRQASPGLAVIIERESNYQVRRWDLRPDDWHLIWPELIKAEGAPPVPSHPPASEVAHTEPTKKTSVKVVGQLAQQPAAKQMLEQRDADDDLSRSIDNSSKG